MGLNIIYKPYTKLQAKKGAAIALRNRLYVSGWELSYTLQYIKNTVESKYFVVLAFENDIPIGVLTCSPEGMLQVFVRKSKRTKGIGRSLIREAAKSYPIEKLRYDSGIKGSSIFFKKSLNRNI